MSDAVRVLAGLRQPDRWSCGATTVVGWRMVVDAAYAASVRGHEPAAVLDAHRALVSPRDGVGRWQVPWPRRLGTPPWSLARAVGGRVRWASWDRLTDAVADGSPVALYVGSRLLPLHVVLAVDLEGQESSSTTPPVGRRSTSTEPRSRRPVSPSPAAPAPGGWSSDLRDRTHRWSRKHRVLPRDPRTQLARGRGATGGIPRVSPGFETGLAALLNHRWAGRASGVRPRRG